MGEQNHQRSFSDRYASGEIPWDNELPPPELIALADQVDPGRALDLGSGYGRTGIYLALRGWQVDGVDFVTQAVEESRARAKDSGVAALARFHVGDVTKLAFLQGNYDLAVDIGCMHNLEGSDLENYRDGLRRLLGAGATYLLFAHLRDPKDDSEDASRWIEEAALYGLFSDGFALSEVVHGITTVADKPPWLSAWFYFRRL